MVFLSMCLSQGLFLSFGMGGNGFNSLFQLLKKMLYLLVRPLGFKMINDSIQLLVCSICPFNL